MTLKRLLNVPERIACDRLHEVCSLHGARVFAKVRLADVLPIEGSGISDASYRFALSAHYDFVIADQSQRPLFAVEYDGPQHDDPEVSQRDALKDALSRRFELPLLRVDASGLCRTEERLDRLTELTEQWLQEREMQDKQLCPKCGSAMQARCGKYGRFLGCVRYPDCRGTCDLPPPSPEIDAPKAPRAAWPIYTGLGIVVSILIVLVLRGADDGSRSGASRLATPAASIAAPPVRSATTLPERQAYVAHLDPADYPLCPDCQQRMVLRRNRSTGEPFFGCSQFPKCRATRKVEYPR